MTAEHELLSPDFYKRTRLPLLEADTMPTECYTSRDFYTLELKKIFHKVWNFVGRADMVPKTGDYYAFDFAEVPILVVRDDDNQIRAFANSCRHRGAKIISGNGNCNAFSCPYHGWTYSLNGRLKAATYMERTAGFNKKDYGLVQLRLEQWGGFLFVCFDDTAESLETFLGDLPQLMQPYDLDRLTCTRRQEYSLECNWKIYIENAMESYHVPWVHNKTLQKQKRDHNPPILPDRGEYSGLLTKHKGSRALLPGMEGFPYIPTLSGDSSEGTYYIMINPSTMLGCTFDTVWWLELHPQGPEQTKLIVGSCFHETTTARDDFERIVQNYYKRLDISIAEDNEISELQQAGLRSPFASPGRFSYMEPLVHVIDNWVLDRVLSD